MEVALGPAADFTSFIWFLAGTADTGTSLPKIEEVERTLRRTLAWVQLSEEQRARWVKVASSTLRTYASVDVRARRRWARSGASISSSQRIERLAREIAVEAIASGLPTRVSDLVRFILGEGRLSTLLNLPEAPHRLGFDRRSGARSEITIALDDFLVNWIEGENLRVLASRYFSAVGDLDFRFEQLGDFINDYFQVFFPWVISAIIRWANELLEEVGSELQIPASIPAYIRWGISDPTALYLMSQGDPLETISYGNRMVCSIG
jgi:hypothetical protein